MPIPREGIITALWTPTDARGDVMVEDIKDNLRFQRQHGVHALLALGSTGEFPHLSVQQRKCLLQLVIEQAGFMPVIANISDIRPSVVAELGCFSKEVGAAAVAVLPPYFFPLAQADLVEFFVRADEAAGLPMFLYNFPERTGNRIGLETIAAVAARVPVAGVKQSGAEFDYHRALVKLGHEKNFVVLTGADTRIPEAMTLGVTGCVSGLANAVPELVLAVFNGTEEVKKLDRNFDFSNPAGAEARIAEAIRAGRISEAIVMGVEDFVLRSSAAIKQVAKITEQHLGALQRVARADLRMKTVGSFMDRLEFPLNVAAAIEARGMPVGQPKSIVSLSTQACYQKLVADLRKLFLEWKLIEKTRSILMGPHDGLHRKLNSLPMIPERDRFPGRSAR